MCLISYFSCVQLFAILWTAAHQAPLSMGFSRHKYKCELLCPPPGNLPHLGTEPASFISPAPGRWIFFTSSARWETHGCYSSSYLPFYFIIVIIFWLHCEAYGPQGYVPDPGPPAVEVWSPKHWATWEIPYLFILNEFRLIGKL